MTLHSGRGRLLAAGLLMLGITTPSGILHGGLPESPSPAACPCEILLSALVEKVEANYPGYHLEVRHTTRQADYRRHVDASRDQAQAADGHLACLTVLQDYVAWFEDGHLFVGGRPPVTTAADSAALRSAAPRVERSLDDALARFDSAGSTLDPGEGVWSDPAGLHLALVAGAWADPSGGPLSEHDLVAYVVRSTVDGWQPGDVKATLDRLPDGSYDAIVYDDVRAATRPHVWKRNAKGGGRLQRNGLLLHMPPTTWGKLYPVPAGLEGRIDPIAPRAPTARRIGDEAVIFHVPSHVPTHAPRLVSLVEQYRLALRTVPTLVIDLRGNEGGSAFVTDVFMPWIATPGRRPARYLAEGHAAVLASEDNVAYFSRVGWAPAGLAERLREAEPGTLVPFLDSPAEPDEVREAPTHHLEAPRNVAILVDDMTVSAAEAFVLRAMRSEKVTLFGRPTGSSIDYQTVGSVRFGCREAGLYVGYPTIVGSHLLPQGGVRPTGIVPDVPVATDGPDPVQRILEHYRTARR